MTAIERLTVRELLRRTRQELEIAGVPEPEIESRLLIQHALSLDAARFLAALGDLVPTDAAGRLTEPLARRLKREPLAYVLGTREFYGRPFIVDHRVLVPRPETELLVERALEFARESSGAGIGQDERLRIADIGTGSGVLAVTLALELPGAQVFATDISPESLAVAKANSEALGAADRVRFLQGDLAAPLEGRFDIVVSNPPYLPPEAVDSGEPELRYEPRAALDGGAGGLEVIRRLVAMFPRVLRPDHALALIEVDPRCSSGAARLVKDALPTSRVEVLPDLAGLDRCVEVRIGG